MDRETLSMIELSDIAENNRENRRNWIHEDIEGNVVECVMNEVTLKLKGKQKKRIGFYNALGNFVKGYPNRLERSKHKFISYNGWGVNYEVVKHLEDDRSVAFITDEGCFYIKKEDIMKDCIKKFSRSGYELQYIIPVNKMTKTTYLKVCKEVAL